MNIAHFLNKNKEIYFDTPAVILLLTSVIVSLLMIMFKIHMSSISLWDFLIPGTGTKILSGTPLTIRSDEYNVQTPFILSQVENGFPDGNHSIGAGKSPLLTVVPVKGLYSFVQPKFWGFGFLDRERGFSWLWAYKSVFLFVSLFLLFMLLTGSNTLLSAAGALWIYSSAFNQWWFSSNLPDLIVAFTWIMISAIYAVLSSIPGLILTGGIFFIISAVNFVLHIYPPFQIPIVILGLFLFTGLVFNRGNIEKIKLNKITKISIAMLSLIMTAVVLFYFYTEAKETIAIVQHTVYPGTRVVTGGGLSLLRIFSGFFDIFAVKETIYPAVMGNVCEASNFIMLFPLLPFLFLKNRMFFKDGIMMALLVYLAFITGWAVIGYPEIIAKISGLNMVTESRSFIGLGIASILLTVIYMAKKKDDFSVKESLLVAIAGMFVLLYYGYKMNGIDEQYFTIKRIFIVAGLFSALIYTIARGHRIIFAGIILLFSFPMLGINPVAQGLDSFYGKNISRELIAESRKVENSRWLVVDNGLIPQYLKALGINVINGTIYTPDTIQMRVLDPDGQYESIWNRYANIIIRSEPELKRPVFQLLQTDQYEIKLNLCSGDLRKIGITHILMPETTGKDNFNCLQKSSIRILTGMGYANLNVYQYKLKE